MIKKGPRPKKASKKRGKMIGIKVTPEEHRRFRQAAGDESVSTWARDRLLEILDGGGKPKELPAEQAKAMNRRLDKLEAELLRLIKEAAAEEKKRK